jgi:hypothetical protein
MTLKRKKQPSQAAEVTQPPLHILYVPRSLLRDTASYFLPYCQARVETACYWFGIEADTCQVATTLVLPRLYQTAGNYSIDITSSRRLANEMVFLGLVNLAQVHTHPPHCSVRHSRYDDQHAYSTRNGSLSLVWPDYGCSASQSLTGVGVHERRSGRWIQLTEAQIAERIHLVESVADYRWDIVSGGIEERHDTGYDF